MFDDMRRYRERARTGRLTDLTHVPSLGEGMPQQPDLQPLTTEMQRPDGSAKGDVAGLERPIHVRRQARGHVPVVRFGKNVVPAPQPHPAIPHSFFRSDTKARTLFGRHSLVLSPHPVRDDPGIGGETMVLAPGIERRRRTLVRQQFAVQRLDDCQRRNAGKGGVGPLRRGLGKGRRRAELAQGEKHERRSNDTPQQISDHVSQPLLWTKTHSGIRSASCLPSAPDHRFCAVNVIDARFVVHGNVTTAGGCLVAQYLGTWVIARGTCLRDAENVLHHVAPVGERALYIDRALSVVTPFVGQERPIAA